METEKAPEKINKKSKEGQETMVSITEKEYEKKVIGLAKSGLTSEKIGEELRSQNIHPKEFKKKISKILKENDLYENADLKNITNKLEKIKIHYEKNKQDKRAKREKDRIFSQLRKIKKHFGLLEKKKK